MKIYAILINYDDEAQKLYIPLLSDHGITAHIAPTMQDALILLVESEYSCVVINGDYFEYLPLLKVLRKITTVPIGVSVTHYDPKENHAAIQNGADIFRVRYDGPENRIERFSHFVKISIEYREGQSKPLTILSHGDLQVFPYTRKVYVKGVEIRLLRKEFEILCFLMMNKGIIMTHQQIFLRVWGEEYDDNAKECLWNHISRLRSKLQIDPKLPEYIVTERHYGYSFNPREKTK